MRVKQIAQGTDVSNDSVTVVCSVSQSLNMRNITITLLLVCVAVASCAAKDLVIGTNFSHLAWRTKVNAMAYPFAKRVKEIFYSNPDQSPIRGIIVRDLDRVEGSVESITAGGIGLSYVNVRLKAPRGRGLNYQIDVYI